MFQAMHETLVSDIWKQNVRFVGYGAFGPSHFGRWDGWKECSLVTDQWTSPDWHIWDGGSTEPLEPWQPTFEQLLQAVDRVYADPTLEEFWRRGTLVANRAHPHPFQADIPDKYRTLDRWFLLDTSLDPPRPWELTTDLPVFSLALVQGQPGARRWLVYAHSQLQDRSGVEITLPDFGRFHGRSGAVSCMLLWLQSEAESGEVRCVIA